MLSFQFVDDAAVASNANLGQAERDAKTLCEAFVTNDRNAIKVHQDLAAPARVKLTKACLALGMDFPRDRKGKPRYSKELGFLVLRGNVTYTPPTETPTETPTGKGSK